MNTFYTKQRLYFNNCKTTQLSGLLIINVFQLRFLRKINVNKLITISLRLSGWKCNPVPLTTVLLRSHCRLSPVTLLRYAALCTVGQLARKISLSWIINEAVSLVPWGNLHAWLANKLRFTQKNIYLRFGLPFKMATSMIHFNLLTAITSRVATLISVSSKVHVTIEYHVKQTRTISEE